MVESRRRWAAFAQGWGGRGRGTLVFALAERDFVVAPSPNRACRHRDSSKGRVGRAVEVGDVLLPVEHLRAVRWVKMRAEA